MGGLVKKRTFTGWADVLKGRESMARQRRAEIERKKAEEEAPEETP